MFSSSQVKKYDFEEETINGQFAIERPCEMAAQTSCRVQCVNLGRPKIFLKIMYTPRTCMY